MRCVSTRACATAGRPSWTAAFDHQTSMPGTRGLDGGSTRTRRTWPKDRPSRTFRGSRRSAGRCTSCPRPHSTGTTSRAKLPGPMTHPGQGQTVCSSSNGARRTDRSVSHGPLSYGPALDVHQSAVKLDVETSRLADSTRAVHGAHLPVRVSAGTPGLVPTARHPLSQLAAARGEHHFLYTRRR